VLKNVAALAAVAVLGFGATAIADRGSSTTQAAPSGQTAPVNGQAAPRGMFSPATGATLAKLKSVATARYPGTVERAVQLPDGSYEVHVFRANGEEIHVRVSKDFKVTGTEQGGPPAGGQPAPGTGPATQS
jgi:hypothetical protein